MKSCRLNLLVLSFVFVFAGAAMAADFVDIGLPASETGHFLVSWGPIEPATSGGAYGGVTDCRAIWSSSDNSVNASVDMLFAGGSELVSFRHLSGPADDSFEVWIGGFLVYTYTDPNNPGESWYVQGFNYTPVNPMGGMLTITFVATGIPWSGWGTYGQVCFDEIWVGPGGPVSAETDSWGGVKSLFR